MPVRKLPLLQGPIISFIIENVLLRQKRQESTPRLRGLPMPYSQEAASHIPRRTFTLASSLNTQHIAVSVPTLLIIGTG